MLVHKQMLELIEIIFFLQEIVFELLLNNKIQICFPFNGLDLFI
jgi:hypothetical protein